MRVNDFIQSSIPNLEEHDFKSWLDIGSGNGLVAQEWRYFQNIPLKIAIDSGSQEHDLDGYKLFEFLDDNWRKINTDFPNGEISDKKFDLVTMMDSIQYFDKSFGHDVLDNLNVITNKLIIIWTPDGHYPHKGHQCGWKEEELKERDYEVVRAKEFHAGPPIISDALVAYKFI